KERVIVHLAFADGDADPPVAEGSQALDRTLRDALEVKVDPRIGTRRLAASESDERRPSLEKIFDPFIEAPRLADDDAIGEATLDEAAEMLVVALVGAAHQHHDIEPAAGEELADAVEDAHENGVGERHLAVRLEDEGDHVGGALAEAPSRLVGRIVERARRLEHAPARLLADVAATVEGARDRPDRDVEMAGEGANAQVNSPTRAGLYAETI